MNALVLGTIGIDDIETPFERAPGLLGGSATYAAIAAAVHAPTRMVSIVGQDFTEAQRQLLAQRGIDLQGLAIGRGQTFRWGGRYHLNYDDRDTTFTHLNVLAEFDPVLPESYRDSEFVLLGNVDPVVQLKVLNQINRPKLVVLDTMNFWLQSQRAAVEKALSRANIAVINEEEVRLYSGHHSITRAAGEMMERGLEALVIKRGAYGAALRTRAGWFFVAGYPLLEVRDPTGAGDAFAGGLVGYLAGQGEITEQTLRKGVVHGSVLASFTVQSFGVEALAQAGRSEIEKRYQEFLRFSQVELMETARTGGGEG